jgi:hypothetical protein
MTGLKGRKNQYVCTACGGSIITVDRDEGTTPFMTDCKTTGGCPGHMQSEFYSPTVQGREPTHEWYRATEQEIATKKNPAACLQHHKMGGLFLREIPTPAPPSSPDSEQP